MASKPPPKARSLALAPAHLDAFLLHLNRCMDTPDGIDIVLSVVCYGARLGAVVLSTAAGRALLHEPVRQLVALTWAFPARASALVLLAPDAPTPKKRTREAAAAASALALADRLRKLGSLMSEARMMLRLWALLSYYVWARALVRQLLARRARKARETSSEASAASETPAATTLDTVIGWTQLASCVGFQVLENAAYLAGRGILPLSPAAQNRASLWSSRAFCLYLATELPRLAAQLWHKVADTPEQRAEAAELQSKLVRYAALAPLTAHWGTEKGLFGEAPLALFGSVSAAIQIRKLWRQTAE